MDIKSIIFLFSSLDQFEDSLLENYKWRWTWL